MLFGVLCLRPEMPWARVFPLRLMLRLGAEYRYYPAPLVSTRWEHPVLGILDILVRIRIPGSVSKFSQRYIAKMIGFACNSRLPLANYLKGRPITFCNSTKSPFSKLPKGNGAPYAKSGKFSRNCMRYSMNLRQFAKRSQITFGALAKGNLFPFAMFSKK